MISLEWIGCDAGHAIRCLLGGREWAYSQIIKQVVVVKCSRTFYDRASSSLVGVSEETRSG